MAIGCFLLLAQLSGTHCLKTFLILNVLQTVAEDILVLAVLVCLVH